jgi:hypothetical protein
MIVIGIDSGKNTGLAMAENGKLKALTTVDFWGAIYEIDSYPDAIIVIELSGTHVWHREAKSFGAIAKTGQNIGAVRREAQLIIQYLHWKGREYVVQKPLGKIDSKQFKHITGWKGKSNQHTRDAAMLALSIFSNT